MNTGNIRKYATELIERDYPRAHMTLRQDDCFCVEGAICDIYGQGEWEQRTYGRYYYVVNGHPWNIVMPDTVEADLYGTENYTYLSKAMQRTLYTLLLEDGYASARDYDGYISYMSMNDDFGMTPKQIGQYMLRACDILEA